MGARTAPPRSCSSRAASAAPTRAAAAAVGSPRPRATSATRRAADPTLAPPGGLLSGTQLADFAAGLKAADPAEQEWCQRVICGRERPASQSGQDLFLWFNFFAQLTLAGRRGFYVDSGANSARHLSNTFFFDKRVQHVVQRWPAGWLGGAVDGRCWRLSASQMPPSEVVAQVEPRPHQTHRVTPC